MACPKCGKESNYEEFCTLCVLEKEVASINVTEVEKKEYNKLLLKDNKLFKIIFISGFSLGLLTIVAGGFFLFMLPSLVFGFLGFKNLFIKKEAKDEVVRSKLIENIAESHILNGSVLREDANLIRVRYDPLFRKNAISIYTNHISSLKTNRIKEIQRIENARWTHIVRNKLKYNATEGKVTVNNTTCFFSDIKGAFIVKNESYRVETKGKSVSKKKGSLGGAIAGGIVMGGAGALIGGIGLAKTKTTTTGTQDVIPTCVHLGIAVNINNFQHEIVLSNEVIDQTSKKFRSLLQEAENVLHNIQRISSMPVPQTYLLPEQESSVIVINKKIFDAEHELELLKFELSQNN